MLFTERVFLGFQFASSFYSRSILERLLVDSVVQASNEIRRTVPYLKIEPQLVELKPAEGVTEAVLQLVDNSDFCIFEISDNNPNVMFELGNAYAKGKRLIFLKNSESKPLKEVPSDIVGKFILYYGGDAYPKLEHLRPAVTQQIHDHYRNSYNARTDTLVRRVWDIRGDNLLVVSGNLYGEYKVEPLDADALFESTIKLVNLYPGLKVRRLYSVDVEPRDFVDTDILAVGGSDSNKVSELVLSSLDSSFPFAYKLLKSPDDLVLRDLHDGREYKPTIDSDEEVTGDYGFYLKAPNPYSPERNVLLITGIWSEGTLGCSKALPSESADAFEYYTTNFGDVADKRFLSFLTEATVEGSNVHGRVLRETVVVQDEDGKTWRRP